MSQLLELLDAALDARLVDVHTALPGRIVSYDAEHQTADVQPMLRRALQDQDGEKVLEALPILPCVPVVFPRGGGCFVSFPMAAGDGGLLVFSERAIDRWRSTGENADPGDLRMHGLSGAAFFPGLYPRADALADADATEMRLGRDGGPQIAVTGAGIEIGAGATEHIALGDVLQTFLDAFLTGFLAHAHPSNGSPPSPLVPPLGPSAPTVASAAHTVEP
jgi:hypothetical protein